MNKFKHRLNLRLTEKEFNKAKMLAGMYAAGNVSHWIRYCLNNYIPKFLEKESQPKKSAPHKKD
jgi:hypothetical protein